MLDVENLLLADLRSQYPEFLFLNHADDLFHSDLQKTIRVRRFVDHLTVELLNIRKDMQAGNA